MSKDEDLLARVAEGVADGAEVDWSVGQSVDPDLKSKLRNLRVIAEVNAIYRRQSIPGAEVASESGPPSPSPVSPQEVTASTAQGETLKLWGRLGLIKRIGGGSYGEVFEAHDPALDRTVALKLLYPGTSRQEADGVIREAKQLARVRHSNVLAVHGAEERDGRIGIWSDYIEGKTLEQCLKDQGPFGAEEASLIGIDVLRALAAVHAAGLVHRDIKAANVMREKGGRIVLMDFGSAVDRRVVANGPDMSGTAVYLAPELFKGGAGGIAADIYAVGVLLFRLVAGSYPVDGSTVADLAAKHRAGESARLRDLRPDLPSAFVQVVERALSSDPCERYRSVGEFEQALSGPAKSGEPAVSRARVKRWPLVAVATAVAVVALVLIGRALLPAGAFGVDAALFRCADGMEERLREGARIVPGDRLFMEVAASKKMHLYVFDEDSKGEAYLLFPLSGADPKNPLEGGTKHRIPGKAGELQQYWNVTSSGGRETIYVIASRNPLEDLEERLASLPQAGSGVPLALSDSNLDLVLRGIGGISSEPMPEPVSSQTRLSNLFDRLKNIGSESRGLWAWKLELENP